MDIGALVQHLGPPVSRPVLFHHSAGHSLERVASPTLMANELCNFLFFPSWLSGAAVDYPSCYRLKGPNVVWHA